MTNTEITQTIEKEFGWLSPDEKQKLNVMMVKIWNEAIVASANLVGNENNAYQQDSRCNHEQLQAIQVKPLSLIKSSINALKLKL